MMKPALLRKIIIIAAVLIAYSSSLTLEYALDDRLVILENDYTTKGFSGLKEVFTRDSFTGFFGNTSNLVAGGRYRPLSQFTFIVEYELFGGKIKDKVGTNHDPANEALFNTTPLPFVSHSVNILLYIILCLLVYSTLSLLFPQLDHKKWYRSVPFIATLLFALHPLHTEAVANIKGRDEILCMLGAFSALWFSLKYVSSKKAYFLLLSFLCMSIGLFSKENAITFLAVIPLAIYYFDKETKVGTYCITLIPIVLSSILFLFVRYEVLGSFLAPDTTHNILNDPFIDATTAQRVATVIFTWGIYLKLLLFPHPLTHDYYPKQIALCDFSNPVVWILITAIVFLIIYSLCTIKKRSLFSFGILFFIITFSITSNLLFSVGTFMNERFVFIPLLGYTFCIALLFNLLLSIKVPTKLVAGIIIAVCCLFTTKTFTRNFTWKNDITLFTTDVKVSNNSIKCNISAGGSYLKLYKENHKQNDLAKAQSCLAKALQLDSLAYNAHLLMGEIMFLRERYQDSYAYYKNAAFIDPGSALARENMDIVLQAMAHSQLNKAEKLLEEGKVTEALQLTETYIREHPDRAAGYNLKGKIYGKGMNDMGQSIVFLKKAIEIDPAFESALENLGVAYAIQGNYKEALYWLERAHALSPDNRNIIANITMVKQNMP